MFVNPEVKFGNSTVEGLRISPQAPQDKRLVTPEMTKAWENAKAAFMRDGNLVAVLKHVRMTEQDQERLMAECPRNGNV